MALIDPECGEHATGCIGREFVRELLEGARDGLCAYAVGDLCAVEHGQCEGGHTLERVDHKAGVGACALGAQAKRCVVCDERLERTFCMCAGDARRRLESDGLVKASQRTACGEELFVDGQSG